MPRNKRVQRARLETGQGGGEGRSSKLGVATRGERQHFHHLLPAPPSPRVQGPIFRPTRASNAMRYPFHLQTPASLYHTNDIS